MVRKSITAAWTVPAGTNPSLRMRTGMLRRSSLRGILQGFMVISVVAVCISVALAQETITLVGSGGSSPLPVYRAWAAEYNKHKPTVRLQYLTLDTRRSISEIVKGNGDFGGGDTPLNAEERGEGKVVELPILVIGLVPIYNVPGVSQDLRFSGDLLAEIYLGHVKKWNAPQIAQLNPHVSLPDLPIEIVYRAPGKGTNYIFTDFLSKSNAEFRDKVGRSISPAWPVGESTERSEDMATRVMSEPGSIGFVELQYARERNIPFGEVRNAAGKFVKASPETLQAACVAAEAPGWDKFFVSLTNAPGADSYPIASFTWVYLRTTATDQRRRAALLGLMHWMFVQGQDLVPAGYAALPEQLRSKETAKLDSLK